MNEAGLLRFTHLLYQQYGFQVKVSPCYGIQLNINDNLR